MFSEPFRPTSQVKQNHAPFTEFQRIGIRMSDLESWARQLPRSDYDRLKAAWRDLVEACGGPDRVSKLTRARNHSLITEYGKPHCLDRFPPLDVIADLEAECGQPIVTRVVADMAGCDLVCRETKPLASVRSLIAAVTRETADVTAKFLEAEPGGLSESERIAIRLEADQAIDKLNALRAALAPERHVRAVK
jgi:hypothetical protein